MQRQLKVGPTPGLTYLMTWQYEQKINLKP